MNISEKGLKIIKTFEGLSLEEAPDPGTGGKPWTIGYGHTLNVHKGDAITQDQADRFLVQDTASAEQAVRRLCPITSQNQFDALVSFCFNVGASNLEHSTLRKLHNEGDYAKAADEFLKWIYADHKILRGLVARRKAESDLYRSNKE